MKSSLALPALLVAASMSGTAAAQSATTGPVPVYDSTQVALGGYTVIKRISVENWRSAFSVPGHADLNGARQAVVDEAGRLGADAVVNLVCMNKTDRPWRSTGFYCYGSAVKVRAPKAS